MENLLTRSAIELASLIRDGQLSARELTETCLRRIDQLDPEVGAFTHVAHDAALQAAGQVGPSDPRPFAGVPIAIKDNRAVAGMPLTMCSDLFGDLVPGHDSYLVRRLREAGFVLVGKTKLPEMGILPTTEPRRFGPARNPWSLERTPGGSSGGAGAAVAAGMVPLAHGNDGGGSIRIPAACCGLVGLKTSRGRVSLGPEIADSFLLCEGVLTRTVADTTEVLDVLAGYEPGDATWAPPPPAPFAELAAREPARVRVAVAVNPPLEGAEVDPLCEQAARDAAMLLESLGHELEEVTPPWTQENVLAEFTRLWAPMISLTTSVGGMLRGSEPREQDVEPLSWLMWERAQSTNSLAALAAEAKMKSLARTLVSFLDRYDIVVTPALARRPVQIGEIHGLGPDAWGHYQRSGHFTPFTAICNISGQPAIAVPLYQGGDGLPLGVQLIGRPAREDTLLAVAAQLERALPWSERLSPLAAR